MKLTTLTAALAVALLFAQSAQAREYHRHGIYRGGGHHLSARTLPNTRYFDSSAATFGYWAQSTYQGGHGGRPRAWCGWQMRQLVGGDPGPQFNLARNWAHWGQAGPAGVGAVVVWAHHVGKIVGEENGQWIIESGNDGNRVRTRPLSISGALAIRWG
jgi:hypothetical protein